MDVFSYVLDFDNESLESYLKINNINVLNDDHESLLHVAIKSGNDYAFDLLIKNYIDINVKDNLGNTPLIDTIIYNKLGYFKRLVREKADLNICNNKLESPIMIALNKNRNEMAQILFDENVDLSKSDVNDENIYFSLVKSHNLDMLKKNLKSDSKYLYSKNFTKRTLLHQAVMISDYDIASYLLDLGILSNVADNFGETPIYFAIRNNDKEMVSLLMNKGALLGMVNSFFETPFDISKADMTSFLKYKENEVKYLKYIRKYPLHVAVIYNDYVRTKELLNKYNYNKLDDFNMRPMDYAIKLEHMEIYKLFLNFEKLKKNK